MLLCKVSRLHEPASDHNVLRVSMHRWQTITISTDMTWIRPYRVHIWSHRGGPSKWIWTWHFDKRAIGYKVHCISIRLQLFLTIHTSVWTELLINYQGTEWTSNVRKRDDEEKPHAKQIDFQHRKGGKRSPLGQSYAIFRLLHRSMPLYKIFNCCDIIPCLQCVLSIGKRGDSHPTSRWPDWPMDVLFNPDSIQLIE